MGRGWGTGDECAAGWRLEARGAREAGGARDRRGTGHEALGTRHEVRGTYEARGPSWQRGADSRATPVGSLGAPSCGAIAWPRVADLSRWPGP